MNILLNSGLLCEEGNYLTFLEKCGLTLETRNTSTGKRLSQLYDNIFNECTADQYINIIASNPEPEKLYIARKNVINSNLLGDHFFCWADDRTTLLLDFWHDLEPKLNYLLIYQPPWVSLDCLFKKQSKIINDSPETALNLWLNHNQALLNFYNSHKEQCLMVNSYFLGQTPTNLVLSLNNKFGFELKPTQSDSPDPKQPEKFSLLLYSQALGYAAPEVIELYLQMESCADLLGREPDFECQEQLYTTLTQAKLLQKWSGHCRLESNNELQKIDLESQVDHLMAECDSLRTGLSAKEEQINLLKNESNKTNTSLAEIEQESELCLLQLHQIQEELEHYYLLNQENEKLAKEYQSKLADVEDKNQEIEKLLKEYQSTLTTAKNKISNLYTLRLDVTK